jgi:hypothetical protein
MILVDAGQRIKFVPPSDESVTLVLRPLTGRDHVEILSEGKVNVEEGTVLTGVWSLVSRVVVGWEGVVDGDGKPVPFSTSALARFPSSILLDVFMESNRLHRMEGQDRSD